MFKALNDKMDLILSIVQKKSGDSAKVQPINLSAGGCRFASEEYHDMRAIMDITIRFTDETEIRGLNYVVMCRKGDATPFGSYQMAVEFQSMIDSHRNILDNKIMERQRDMIKEKREAGEAA